MKIEVGKKYKDNTTSVVVHVVYISESHVAYEWSGGAIYSRTHEDFQKRFRPHHDPITLDTVLTTEMEFRNLIGDWERVDGIAGTKIRDLKSKYGGHWIGFKFRYVDSPEEVFELKLEEPKNEWVDCKLEEYEELLYFYTTDFDAYTLDEAPSHKLFMGYVYEDGTCNHEVVRYMDDEGCEASEWREGMKTVRPVAVRMMKEDK